MLLRGPGRWRLACTDPSQELVYASASAHEPATVRIYRGDELTDEVFVSNGQTHTWWNHNPLFYPVLREREEAIIEITGRASMRIVWEGGKVNDRSE